MSRADPKRCLNIMNFILEAIINYLHKNKELGFSEFQPAMIERIVNQRLTATQKADFSEYLKYLKNRPDEADNLVDALMINESSFFRNTLIFDYIAEKILPSIISKKVKDNNETLRIWSAGCSRGEEPYSIAILINELFKNEDLRLRQNVSIFATDINQKAINQAQEAIYQSESIKDIKYGLLEKYFIKENKLFKLIPKIKQMVNFSLYDMLDKKTHAPPESVYGHFDMIFCRNLLIYFQPSYQEVIFNKLHHSLAQKGYLVLGDVEVPTIKYRDYFEGLNKWSHIYQKI